MFSLRTLALSAVAASVAVVSTEASAAFRASEAAVAAAASSSFSWVEDPHAADPCTSEPGCFNSVKYGYNVVPVNISSDANVVFQVAKRPTGVSAVMNLDVYTQPGCGVSACHMISSFLVFKKEECYNAWVEKNATETDGKTAKLAVGGIYYENLPTGELYAKFEKKNYLTDKSTCTYEVRSGFKRWF